MFTKGNAIGQEIRFGPDGKQTQTIFLRSAQEFCVSALYRILSNTLSTDNKSAFELAKVKIDFKNPLPDILPSEF